VVEEQVPDDLGPNQVRVRMIAAPLNPADFNMIEGVYSIRPPLPAVGGNEGVGEIEAVGANVTDFKTGDWVLPAQPGFGTWRSHVLCDANDMVPVANDIEPEQAAMIAVNPCSAYRMLHDFVDLQPGDVIVQNGSTSAVGQCVIQLARSMGIKTLNLIRDR
jgi:mitochondrial enoyl-[acyl-carrier protein] reductase / trans-2-enoyl-CoA reductase